MAFILFWARNFAPLQIPDEGGGKRGITCRTPYRSMRGNPRRCPAGQIAKDRPEIDDVAYSRRV